MKQDRFSQIDSLLDAVLDAPTLEREKILNERCKDDTSLKTEVLALLNALGSSDDFIESANFGNVKNFLDETDEFVGKKVGAYRLGKMLGRGGMGAVYLATRIDDFEKEVAVKIIPSLENQSGAAENFRRERQILARLSHKNIAQILDGGTTEENTPFIVMEYVDGLPLNRFCREKNLTICEKLKLFQDVCAAVAYAHQHLVVHRDLKPNNILICDDGTPKLLDFGIAKMLDTDAFGVAENKTFDDNALTLEYASPEQINGENITVASDVYSLGIILYELLTEKRPHDFKQKSLAKILRIITKENPLAPSEIPNSTSQISDVELDSIVLKSLAKSLDERYKSVGDFSLDIENYLNFLPVSARPNSNFYKFKKYIQRHRIETAIAALVMFLIVGWLITFVWQIRKEQAQSLENRQTAYAAEMILAANEYENANLNRLKELVEKYGDERENLRGFEWNFLNNLLNPSSKIKTFTHSDEVWSAEFSPDGKFIASACNDNRAWIWNVQTGAVVKTEEQKGAWKVSFFPDGKRLAVSSSSSSNPIVKIYETATAKEILTLRGHTKRVRALDVSPDGKLIATGSQDGSVIIWNAETGAELKRLLFTSPEKNTEFQDVQFSKRGDKLAISGFEILAILDTKTWQKKQIAAENFLDKNILLNGWQIVFSPLEKTLALGTFEGNVVFLDAETLEIIRILKLHQSNVKSLAFSADGKILATASWDRTVKFVDVQTGEILNELRGHFSGVHEIIFSPDGKTLATASADFNINLWNAEAVSNANALLANAGISTSTADGNEFFTLSNLSGNIVRWRISDKKPVWTTAIEFKGFSIDFSSAANRLAIGDNNGTISTFDAGSGIPFKKSNTHNRAVFAIRFSPDGKRIFAGYEDGLLKCLNAENLTEIYSIQAHKELFKGLDVAPDGKFLVTGGNDNLVKVIETATGKIVFTLEGNTKPLYKTIFSPDGKTLATTGADDTARIWNLADGKLLKTFSGMSGGIFAVTFSPDGKRLATASDVGIIRLWNTETSEQVLAFTASQKEIIALKFTADGKTLISTDINGKVNFWSGK